MATKYYPISEYSVAFMIISSSTLNHQYYQIDSQTTLKLFMTLIYSDTVSLKGWYDISNVNRKKKCYFTFDKNVTGLLKTSL